MSSTLQAWFFPAQLLALLLLCLTSSVFGECSNCEKDINLYCCKTSWHGVCCEYPLDYYRGSASYVDDFASANLRRLKRRRRRNKNKRNGGNVSRIDLESKLLQAVEKLLEQNS